MTAPLGNDTHDIAFELTKLRSELRLAKLDLRNRILDLEVRLAWRRLYATWAVGTALSISLLGTLIVVN